MEQLVSQQTPCLLALRVEMGLVSFFTIILSSLRKASKFIFESVFSRIATNNIHLVLSVYSKSGGKNGKHGRVDGVSTIMAASYIPSQVFEHQHSVFFTDVPKSQRHLQLKQFTLLSPAAFLINLDCAPVTPQNGRLALEISHSDLSRFFLLQKNLQNLLQVQKLLSGRKKIAISDNEEEDWRLYVNFLIF